ncbi:3,4-dihydroxy-2-butanone-4-phosphate synthase [Oleispirillum naphthae]|uniref:3,4-dihydroxy-2-butanone-4-phosphate synthase n=1 Tax=Oleispirillum naphthae TaxID=2838853 RepID=UPI003082524D
MNQTVVKSYTPEVPFCSPDAAADRVARAVAALKAGRGVVVTDDPDRENEGDMIFAAHTLTAAQMALLIREGSGIVCLVLTAERCRQLGLPPMVADNSSAYGTPFTVSIEAASGVTTGVSAADRVATVKAATDPAAKPQDLARPGHVFPLAANPQGLAGRQGHTEATLDLMRRAGLPPAGVLCEVTNPDGTMAKGDRLTGFAYAHALPIVSIADLLKVPG